MSYKNDWHAGEACRSGNRRRLMPSVTVNNYEILINLLTMRIPTPKGKYLVVISLALLFLLLIFAIDWWRGSSPIPRNVEIAYRWDAERLLRYANFRYIYF